MTYTPEQVGDIKKQIFEQTKNLSDEQRKQIEKQVDKMSPEQLEAFVQQQMSRGEQGQSQQKGIFRMIVEGDVPSKKIEENDFAIAVVSKRAVSKGHVLVIPKTAVIDENKMPKGVEMLADEMVKRMKSKLDAKDVKKENTSAFGERIIDLIPVYDKEIDKSKAYESSDAEIQEIHDKLWVAKKLKLKVVKIDKQKNSGEIVKLKRRIP